MHQDMLGSIGHHAEYTPMRPKPMKPHVAWRFREVEKPLLAPCCIGEIRLRGDAIAETVRILDYGLHEDSWET